MWYLQWSDSWWCTLLLWRLCNAGGAAVILKQTLQTILHRICQRHINITLRLWIGAFDEPVRSPRKKQPTWDRQLCRCWRASFCTAEQTAAYEKKSLTSIMHVFKWGPCSVGSFACIDKNLDFYTVFKDLAGQVGFFLSLSFMSRQDRHKDENSSKHWRLFGSIC